MRSAAHRAPQPKRKAGGPGGQRADPAEEPAAAAPARWYLYAAAVCALLLLAGSLLPALSQALRGTGGAGGGGGSGGVAPVGLAAFPLAAAPQPTLPLQSGALPSPPPPAPQPSPFPPSTCGPFQDTLATAGSTLLQMVRVEGVTPLVQMYLLAHAPEAPLEIEAAMTRTEAMMAVAYKKILLDPYWSTRPAPAASTVVEVGVHGGWFATLAHIFGGHRVVGFDMQPYCVLVARCALQVNAATSSHPVILNRYVSHGEATVGVSSTSCGGGLGVGNRERGEVAVHPVHLGRFFADPSNLAALALQPDFEVPLLKSDTEGFEGIVLETVLPMLGRVHNILLEVFGTRWKMHGIAEARALAVFECLHAAGMDEMVDLPRRDIDFISPGDIDLDNLPPERLRRTWEEWREQLGNILADKNGVSNPNLWLRWSSQERRRALDIRKVPKCQASLAQSSYAAPP
jgi:hypothetical protein